jgi:hypothetical protein
MQDMDTCVAAKAQSLPAESSVDEFRRHIDAGWERWRNRQSRVLSAQQQQRQPLQLEEKQHALADATATGAAGGHAEGQQQADEHVQQERQQEPQEPQKLAGGQAAQLLLLGRYEDAQAWLVREVLPGLQRHSHLAGLQAMLHKWTSRDLVGVSDCKLLQRHGTKFFVVTAWLGDEVALVCCQHL